MELPPGYWTKEMFADWERLTRPIKPDEIELTPEMADAGVSILLDHEHGCDSRATVKEIFQAMLAARK